MRSSKIMNFWFEMFVYVILQFEVWKFHWTLPFERYSVDNLRMEAKEVKCLKGAFLTIKER